LLAAESNDQPMNAPEIALIAFTACNTLRVFAYIPQIVRIGRDSGGAAAISYWTWSLFAASHLSTVAYAIAVVRDMNLALIFAANTGFCAAIVILTAIKRRRAAGDPTSRIPPSFTFSQSPRGLLDSFVDLGRQMRSTPPYLIGTPLRAPTIPRADVSQQRAVANLALGVLFLMMIILVLAHVINHREAPRPSTLARLESNIDIIRTLPTAEARKLWQGIVREQNQACILASCSPDLQARYSRLLSALNVHLTALCTLE
jgi:hypothetical protein